MGIKKKVYYLTCFAEQWTPDDPSLMATKILMMRDAEETETGDSGHHLIFKIISNSHDIFKTHFIVREKVT